MDTFWWIFLSGLLMSMIALVGSLTLLLSQATLDRIIMPLVAYAVSARLGSARLDVGFLVPFAAGNFIYIGASDLVPEVNKHNDVRSNVLYFVSFIVEIALLREIRIALG